LHFGTHRGPGTNSPWISRDVQLNFEQSVLNCEGQFIHSLFVCFFPSTTVLHNSQLVESTDAELQIRRADYKVTCRLSSVQGFVTLITALFKDQLYVSYYKLHHTATIFFSLMETCSTLPFVSVFSHSEQCVCYLSMLLRVLIVHCFLMLSRLTLYDYIC
jgi:hypothetical protein